MYNRSIRRNIYSDIIKDDAIQRRKCVETAIAVFNERERYLLEHRLSERCICARFAIYLEREVHKRISKEYTADVEYNKGMEEDDYTKKMLHGKRIYPDIIVHKRGKDSVYGYDNMICIEMKKQEDERGLESDHRRLQALTYMGYDGERFCYRSGFMIVAYKLPRGLEIEAEYMDGNRVEIE